MTDILEKIKKPPTTFPELYELLEECGEIIEQQGNKLDELENTSLARYAVDKDDATMENVHHYIVMLDHGCNNILIRKEEDFKEYVFRMGGLRSHLQRELNELARIFGVDK